MYMFVWYIFIIYKIISVIFRLATLFFPR